MKDPVFATCSAIVQIYLDRKPTGEEKKWEWNRVYKNSRRKKKKEKKTKANLEF
jgi:hypothetical protein